MAENGYGLPETADLQSVFDKVSIHLVRQGRPSRRQRDGVAPGKHFDMCLYRGLEGDACAVGCLISDEDYDPALESNSIETLLQGTVYTGEGNRIVGLFPEFMKAKPMSDMLKDLQTIHDHASVDADGRFVRQHLLGHLARVADRFEISSADMWDAVPEEDL